MERTPAGLRERGCSTGFERSRRSPARRSRTLGDLGIEPGFAKTPTGARRTAPEIADFLPREARLVADELTDAGRDARLLVLGGDCTAHAGAMAGLRRAHLGGRIGLAWFDAHGDFNTPDITPSGNVWGMPSGDDLRPR